MERVFKTSMSCGGCVAKATATLNALVGEGSWKVDTTSPDKLLTVTNDAVTASQLTDALKKIGFKAEELG